MPAWYPLIVNTGSNQIQELPSGQDLNLSNSNISNVASITVTNATTAIVNGGTNGTGNIGATGATFNTIFAKSTTAQYADVAEMYVADADYEPGVVMSFGGSHEVTTSQGSHDPSVAGIVSKQPSYLMNATQEGEHVIAVALVGRVPCQVIGTINKGDRLVASHLSGVATKLDVNKFQPGCLIGKALESYDSDTVGTIEVAVGRT